MSENRRIHWVRIGLAIIVAETVPILFLILVVVVYGFTRGPDAISPEEFAPQAGNWVGPIGGFLATLLCARWVARRAAAWKLAHGAAIGVGTALIDVSIACSIEGAAAVGPLFVASNCGRLAAGLLGGWLAMRSVDKASRGHPVSW